jgi:hypothetical protein
MAQGRDGRWEMGDGRWEMGDGRWEMGDGRWEINLDSLSPIPQSTVYTQVCLR